MGFDQYHEPPEELSQESRTMARIFASLTEEAEAINWYEQRLSLEQDPEAVAVIRDAMHEEYKHFSMDLEFLFRRRPEWRTIAKGVLFQPGDLVENAEIAEAAGEDDGDSSPTPTTGGNGSLGLGSLQEVAR
jgi:uncharacterized protein